jgi:glutamine amidotransferase
MQSSHDKNYVCAVQSGHVFGVQFHPEKSHRYGMSLFQGYAAYLAGRNRV